MVAWPHRFKLGWREVDSFRINYRTISQPDLSGFSIEIYFLILGIGFMGKGIEYWIKSISQKIREVHRSSQWTHYV